MLPSVPPELSVVMPTYNRVGLVTRTLEALGSQRLDASRFEIVVVDDGSSDQTVEALRAHVWPFRFRCIEQPHDGPCAALNLGAAEAAAEIVLFLDDDIGATEDLLAEHLAAHQRSPGAVVLGQMDFDVEGEPGPLARQLAGWWPVHYERLERNPENVSYMAAFSGNLSLPKELFLEAGGFATDVPRSYDVELGYRLHQLGARFVYAPRARGRQTFDKDGAAILRDAHREGETAALLLERHPAMRNQLRAGQLADAGAITRLLTLALARLPKPLVDERALRLVPAGQRNRAASILYDATYWRGLRRALGGGERWERLVRPPLILMYHGFAPSGAEASRYVLPADRFGAHLDAITSAGYRVVALDEVVDALADGALPPGRTVVITIDDGYADVAGVAAPLLSARDMRAVVFVVTERMDGVNDWDGDPPLAGRRVLGWDDLGGLAKHGVTVGAHSRSHARLDVLDASALESEVAGALRDLRAHGVDGDVAFAYPYGKADDAARAAVRAAGYSVGLGIRPGAVTADSPIDQLPRYEIVGTRRAAHLRIGLLLGAPDWDTRLRAHVRSAASHALRRLGLRRNRTGRTGTTGSI